MNFFYDSIYFDMDIIYHFNIFLLVSLRILYDLLNYHYFYAYFGFDVNIFIFLLLLLVSELVLLITSMIFYLVVKYLLLIKILL